MSVDFNTVWQDILDDIASNEDATLYDAWLKHLRPAALDDGVLRLLTEDIYTRNHISRNFAEIIARAAKRVLSREIDVDIGVSDSPAPQASAGSGAHRDDYGGEDFDIYDEGIALNEHYLFDNYITGPCNRLPHAAAKAIADSPAQSGYNPFFLHSSVGLGKTHLLQAICHEILRTKPDFDLLYLSCESFVNQFIRSVERKEFESFRHKYRHLDMLVIDDIHFLAAKERTQEEFFHTFNALHARGKQIVLASDSPPSEIPTLEERLVSRFKSGLVASLDPPEYETRVAICRNKANIREFPLPDDVLDYIANHIESNIRELEGAVTRVIGFAQLMEIKPDLNMAREALKEILGHAKPPMSIADIQAVVARYYNLKLSDMTSSKRSKSIVFPRQIAIYLARELTEHSLEEIGGFFGGRDHSTVIHSYEKISAEISQNEELASAVEKLKKELQNSI